MVETAKCLFERGVGAFMKRLHWLHVESDIIETQLRAQSIQVVLIGKKALHM
jgi:hypothetical protein